ncbi:MAG: hypothetical protein LBI65_02910 [Candidatus Symbiothrix sp.]|jgi:hypothetical protein|nr:hypothetical protein [Candidatus Symbiothrix sp.]
MSIKIRLQDSGEIFDMPKDYVVEGENNNPLFERKGSQTVPVNFPATAKNEQLLGFPSRIDNSKLANETIPVTVEIGSAQMRGVLSIQSAGDKTISANIGYDESEMYAKMQQMKLGDIPDLPHISVGITFLLFHLSAVMKEQIEADFAVFPVVLKYEPILDDNIVTALYTEIINDVQFNGSTIAELKARDSRTIKRYENGEEIEIAVPKGYGVSPFLKVYRILELIFSHYGFEIIENPFKDHRQLKKLVVLNNTMDAILTGTLYYKDLMPDMTAKEFLETLYAKFGMVYFVNSTTRTVRIKFLKDLVTPNTYGALQLDASKTGEPSISFAPPRQIRLKVNREIKEAETLADTWEEFLDKYRYEFTEFTEFTSWDNYRYTQLFDGRTSNYVIFNAFRVGRSGEMDKIQSSDFFDWDKKTPGLEYEEIEMKDLCLPFSDYNLFSALYYAVDVKHVYTEVVVSGQAKENKENPAPPAFAFAWGQTKNSSNNYFFASQINRDEKGKFITDENGSKYDVSLTCNREDGLYNRFWKKYDAFIRHSNQEVACSLRLTDRQILQFNMYEIAYLDNQPLIPKQIKYKLNQKEGISEGIFRTLRFYRPYNLTKEQGIPQYGRQKYRWAFTDVEDPAPGENWRWIKTIHNQNFFEVNGVQTPISNLSILPPTEKQFLENEQRIYKYNEVYFTGSLLPLTKQTVVTVTYFPQQINYQ